MSIPARSDVKHMKWWGWGDASHAYRHDDKPKLAAFVKEKVGLDLTAPAAPTPRFEDLDVPASQLSDDLRATLVAGLGADNVVVDDLDRVVHAFGKGVRDLIRVRRGDLGRVPDVVVYPGTEEDVRTVVDAVVAADAVLIPFGGGSNIVAALEALPEETRQVVSMDMGRMNRVLEIDETSSLARIQAGVLGPDMEEQLNARGWTMGHFPDSFNHSTLGGWIATRSTGMQSDKYGDIAVITRGLRLVRPGDVLVLNPLPSTSSGPSVREMILGSEGRLGVITEAWVNVHRLPERREIQAYFFPNYRAGIECMRALEESDVQILVGRVSDEAETAFTMATSKASTGISRYVTKALNAYLTRKGFDTSHMCLSFIGFEGTADHVRYTKGVANQIVREHGGVGVGKGPGTLYDQKKFDTPYIRDFLLDRGAIADVSETSSPWAVMPELHDEVVAAAYAAMAEAGVKGFVMCHVSHNDHSGACQYFTFAVNDPSANGEATYDRVKQAVQGTFARMGATVSHHHGVGEEHSPWMAQDVSPAGVELQRILLEGADPGSNLNPGKIVHTGRPGISSNAVTGTSHH